MGLAWRSAVHESISSNLHVADAYFSHAHPHERRLSGHTMIVILCVQLHGNFLSQLPFWPQRTVRKVALADVESFLMTSATTVLLLLPDDSAVCTHVHPQGLSLSAASHGAAGNFDNHGLC